MKMKIVLLVIIFSVALFLRLYKITDIPNGFNQDESAIGYNAYSILKTGKDEYGKTYPLYFKSFGDQKLPVYIYLTAISEEVFGLNEFAVRFPSALFGSLTVLMIFFVMVLISENKKLSLLTALFLAINPWHLFFSRAAFEDNIALSLVVFGVWMFLLAVKSKKWIYLFPSIVGFVLSLYSYNVTRLLAPVLLLTLVILHWKSLRNVQRKFLFLLAGFFTLLLLPFLSTFLSLEGVTSAHGALITSSDIQAKSLEMRSYLVGSGSLIGKLFFNKYIFILWQYVENIVGSLSPAFLFLTGSSHGSQGIGNAGVFFLFEFPFVLTGLVIIIKNKIKKLYFFIIWLIIALLTLSLSKEVPHATRGYFLVVPFEVLSALGLLVIIEGIRKIKTRVLKIALFLFMILVVTYNLVYYFSSYYYRFPLLYAKSWRQQDKQLALYIKDNERKYNKIIFDNNAGFIYTSLLFFNAYEPDKFQKSVKRLPDDSEGFSYVSSYGHYEWRDIDWDRDLKEPRALIVTLSGHLPTNVGVLTTFYYPQVPIVLSIKERIIQYPSKEEAYVLIETN